MRSASPRMSGGDGGQSRGCPMRPCAGRFLRVVPGEGVGTLLITNSAPTKHEILKWRIPCLT